MEVRLSDEDVDRIAEAVVEKAVEDVEVRDIMIGSAMGKGAIPLYGRETRKELCSCCLIDPEGPNIPENRMCTTKGAIGTLSDREEREWCSEIKVVSDGRCARARAIREAARECKEKHPYDTEAFFRCYIPAFSQATRGSNPEMVHRGTDPEAIKVAERFGLVFDGMQEDLYQFTVAEGPEKAKGITFYVKDLSQVEARLHEKLKEFGIEERNPGNPDELPDSRKTQELIKIADPNIPFNRLWTEETAYMNRLLADIREHGIREPLIVVVREDGSQMVWEGAHRLAVAQRLGITDIPVKYVGPQGKPAPPGGNPDNGRCYEDAWRYLMKEGEGFLVHGTVRLYEGGREVKHAWVELPTGWIWEPQTKSYFTLKDFEITCPIEEHRYTAEEAAIMLARVSKHGPWTDEERATWLHREQQGSGSSGNPGAKVPWQMTLEQYALEKGARPAWVKAGYGETYRTHKRAVERAISEGKTVPPEVLADYPALLKGAK